MLSTWIQSKKDEEGFTLIELLVVVIIIGILAAIAIPVFLNQRENAWRGAAESDARNAAIEIESFMTRDGSYPGANFQVGGVDGDGDPVDSSPEGITLTVSDGVTLNYTAPTDDDSYRIVGTHTELTGESVTYNPEAGGLQDWDFGS